MKGSEREREFAEGKQVFSSISSVSKKLAFFFYTLSSSLSLSLHFRCFFFLFQKCLSRPGQRQGPGSRRLPGSWPLDDLRRPQKTHPAPSSSSPAPAPAPAGERVVSPRHGQPQPQRRLRPPRLPQRGRRRLDRRRRGRGARGGGGGLEQRRLRGRALVVGDEHRRAQRGRGGLERADESDHRRVPRPGSRRGRRGRRRRRRRRAPGCASSSSSAAEDGAEEGGCRVEDDEVKGGGRRRGGSGGSGGSGGALSAAGASLLPLLLAPLPRPLGLLFRGGNHGQVERRGGLRDPGDGNDHDALQRRLESRRERERRRGGIGSVRCGRRRGEERRRR